MRRASPRNRRGGCYPILLQRTRALLLLGGTNSSFFFFLFQFCLSRPTHPSHALAPSAAIDSARAFARPRRPLQPSPSPSALLHFLGGRRRLLCSTSSIFIRTVLIFSYCFRKKNVLRKLLQPMILLSHRVLACPLPLMLARNIVPILDPIQSNPIYLLTKVIVFALLHPVNDVDVSLTSYHRASFTLPRIYIQHQKKPCFWSRYFGLHAQAKTGFNQLQIVPSKLVL